MTRMMPCHALACAVFLAATLGTAHADVWDAGASTNDNTAAETHNELVHGLEQVHDLAARAGVPDEDYYVLSQEPGSFEAIIDSASANVGGIFMNYNFVRLGSDGTTVVQASAPTWGFLGFPGYSMALRWRKPDGSQDAFNYLRVKAACAAACTASDTYRIRFYETTSSIPRFNNSGSQTTVVMLQNLTQRHVSGLFSFARGDGIFLFELPFQIGPYGSLVRNTASIPELQGQAGSVLVLHNAGYGQLTGKSVSVEPATGFVFESPLVPRLR